MGNGYLQRKLFGTDRQQRTTMTCQGCSIKFTVFKRKVSHFVNYTNVTSSIFCFIDCKCNGLLFYIHSS